jgi:hypothetical protein
MKLNAKIVAWVGVLAVALVVARPLSAGTQTQNRTQNPTQNPRPDTLGCTEGGDPGGRCVDVFTNVNNVCVTETYMATPECVNGVITYSCSLVSKTKAAGPCADPGVTGDEACQENCID